MDLKTRRKEIQAKFIQVLSGKETEIIHQPDDPLEQDEQPLGVIKSPVTRALQSLCMELIDAVEAAKAIHRKAKRMKTEGWEDANVDFKREMAMVDKLAESIRAQFWLGIMEEYPLVADEGSDAAVRENWQVVINLDICDCVKCNLRRAVETIQRGEATLGELAVFLEKELNGPQALEYRAIVPPSLIPILSMLDRMDPDAIEIILAQMSRSG